MTQLTLTQLTPHIYWLGPDSTTDRPVLGVIGGEEATLLVDAGNSEAHLNILIDQLDDIDIFEPDFVVLTHSHWDHVFGLSALGLPTFASQETQRIVAGMADLDWSDEALDQRVVDGLEIEFCRDMIKAELPDRSNLALAVPNIAFAKRVELDLGGVTCQMIRIDCDHAADSVVIYVPEDKVLFLGDCIYPNLHNGPSHYTTTKLFPLLDQLLAFDADYYVASHNPEPMTREEMEEECHLLKNIGQTIEELGPDKAEILQALPDRLGEEELDDDYIELVDEFLAGMPENQEI